ncbi:MAG: DUF4861 family protein [Chitinophagaceae bacterium]|nr:DUF4861 family protein [Chitinophagaceae bacterium]
MKIAPISLFVFIISSLPVTAQTLFIEVTNNSSFSFIDKVIEVPWVKVKSLWENIDTSQIKIYRAWTKQELAFQFECKGENEIHNLLIQASVPARSSVKLEMRQGKHTLFATKTYGRYVPERKDDFAWENDKIAFRMYGKALEGTSEDAYGIDVWVKRTSDMVLDKRYKTGDYHIDHGDGLDYYHVGHTLGAGNSAPYIADSIWFSGNYDTYRILDNGPLRTAFQLIYKEWKAGDIPVTVTKTMLLNAGEQLSQVTVEYHFSEDVLPIAIGITKRKDHGIILINEQEGIMGYWEPQYGNDGITGVGVILTDSIGKMTVTPVHLLSETFQQKGKLLRYYTGAVWNKANEIINPEQWFLYLKEYKERLKNPLKIDVIKPVVGKNSSQ